MQEPPIIERIIKQLMMKKVFDDRVELMADLELEYQFVFKHRSK
jgi:hypothetical protein